MNVRFKSSFAKDLRRVPQQVLLSRVRGLIEQIERTQSLEEVVNLKKLRGSGPYYRIRVGDYRVGLIVQGNEVTFVRFLHRREIYRYFP